MDETTLVVPEFNSRNAALEWYDANRPDPVMTAIQAKARAAASRALNLRSHRDAFDVLYLRAVIESATEPNPGQDAGLAESPNRMVHLGEPLMPNPDSAALKLPPNDVYRARMARWPDRTDRLDEVVELINDDPKMRLKRLVDYMQVKYGPKSEVEVRSGAYWDALADLEDGSVDLILTDPPYGEDYVEVYRDLGKWASVKLADGGSLVAYSGQATLGKVIDAMACGDLRYWWTFALLHSGFPDMLQGKRVMARWKPLVWCLKGKRGEAEYIDDLIEGSIPDKERHAWAQGEAELYPIIEKLTEPGQLIVDPFAGSGTTGRAASALGREFIGADEAG